MSAKAKAFNIIAYILSNDYRVIEETLTSEFKSSPGASVLDLGCGTGRFSERFPDINYTGVDISNDYIAHAQTYHGNKFKKMDARKLKFPSESFDYVFSVGLFHHLSDEDSKLAFKELNRVLRPQGKFFVIDAIWPTKPLNLLGYVLRKLDRGKYVRTNDEYLGLFNKSFTVKKNYIKRYGFALEFAFFLLSKSD